MVVTTTPMVSGAAGDQAAGDGAGAVAQFAGDQADPFGRLARDQRAVLQRPGNGGVRDIRLARDVLDGDRPGVMHTVA